MSNNFISILTAAIQTKNPKPNSKTVVDALLTAEKTNHQNKQKYEFNQLIGSWRLHFITGTKNSRQKFGNFIGAGFYLPPFIQININYSPQENSQAQTEIKGKVENQVKFGLVELSVTGPIKFLSKKNILAFDFIHLSLSILGKKAYQTDMRSGTKSEADFYTTNIKQQAFFSYFLVTEEFIAARGRGGGLALWKKNSY